MFTEESFRAVRDHLKPDGLLVVYNYFREQWLVDRLANTAAAAFGQEPRVHVHEARAYLGVLMAGPAARDADVAADRARSGHRLRSIARAESGADPSARCRRSSRRRDDWPFLYLRERSLPRHYGITAAPASLSVSDAGGDGDAARGSRGDGRGSSSCWARDSCCSSPSRSSSSRCCGDRPGSWPRSRSRRCWRWRWSPTSSSPRVEIRRPWLVGVTLVALLGLNFLDADRPHRLRQPLVESLFYAVLMFSPILCAGLLFGSAIKRSTSLARDYGTNLLGAMVGGVGEYLSLVTGFRVLLILHRAVLRRSVAGAGPRAGRRRGGAAAGALMTRTTRTGAMPRMATVHRMLLVAALVWGSASVCG